MKTLLATLADESYLDQAKQLFSSVYFNAGWAGDYLLLAHEVANERLDWFRDKGILVKQCAALSSKPIGRLHPATVSRFYLFETEFKEWDHIVYLDADIIVQGSLNRLPESRGFWAVAEHYALGGQFSFERSHCFKKKKELERKYDLARPSFNAGLLSLSTDLIDSNTFPDLMDTFGRYADCHSFDVGEQPTLNLHFYGRWNELPYFYIAHPVGSRQHYHLDVDQIRAITVHFACQQPWDPDHPYHSEWKANLNRSAEIRLTARPAARIQWSHGQIRRYWRYLRLRRWFIYRVRRLKQLLLTPIKN